MPLLTLKGLSKSYSSVHAVERLDLEVERGEFISILGPSGCGKTTTLQMIAGFVEPSAGSIVLGGHDLVGVPASARGLGIVFQGYALFPHMTAAENVGFGLEMRKLAAAEIRRRVGSALELVGLGAKGGSYPKQMSGGQQQRVALARALVIEPEILLLDEPLSNLDAKLREEMQLELRRIQRVLGTTTILVTHDQQEALALSDRIVVMNAGNVEQVGEPFVVYEHPASDFVASFLGRSNSLSGEVRDGALIVGSRRMMAPPSLAGRVAIAIRPEKIRLAPALEDALEGRIRARVFQGNHWLIHVETPAGPATVIRQNDGTRPPEEGETVGLTWKLGDAFVRPERTGARP